MTSIVTVCGRPRYNEDNCFFLSDFLCRRLVPSSGVAGIGDHFHVLFGKADIFRRKFNIVQHSSAPAN